MEQLFRDFSKQKYIHLLKLYCINAWNNILNLSLYIGVRTRAYCMCVGLCSNVKKKSHAKIL